MRTRDVQIGETYLAEIPHQLRGTTRPKLAEDIARWWQLSHLRGCRFQCTVLDLDPTTVPSSVDVVRVVDAGLVKIALTAEQRTELNLPPDSEYSIFGWVHRDGSDTPIQFPTTSTLRLPCRWLHPPDEPRPPTHRLVGFGDR